MIIAGALQLTEKTARDVMTSITETFAIELNAKLDRCVSVWVSTYQYVHTCYLMRANTKVTFMGLLCKTCRDLMDLIIEKGHSRVPVYYEKPSNIIGLILVSDS